uniref:Uncharacterized protein n=1 Tax=Neospora caninum (strain Liverpool) TaxID=572307 RepID=A0A0F7UQJ1_NEOCL|nr:TPA: hypothetical protein BN1204_063665 [Neospora caninum Liverpool]
MALQFMPQLFFTGDRNTRAIGEIARATEISDVGDGQNTTRHVKETLFLGLSKGGEAHSSSSPEGDLTETPDGADQDAFSDTEESINATQRREGDTTTSPGGQRKSANGEKSSPGSGSVAFCSARESPCYNETASSRFECKQALGLPSGLRTKGATSTRQRENVKIGSLDEGCSREGQSKAEALGESEANMPDLDHESLELVSALFEYVYRGMELSSAPLQEQRHSCGLGGEESTNTPDVTQKDGATGEGVLEGRSRCSLPSKLSVPLPGSDHFASASALSGALFFLGSASCKSGDNVFPIIRQASAAQANGIHSGEQARLSGSAQEGFLRSATVPISSTSSFCETEPCVDSSSSDLLACITPPTTGPLVYECGSPTSSSANAPLYFLPSDTGRIPRCGLHEAVTQETDLATRSEVTRSVSKREAPQTESVDVREGRIRERGEDCSEGGTKQQESVLPIEALLLRLPCNPSSCPTCLRAVEKGDTTIDIVLNRLTDLHTHLSLTMDLLLRQQLCQQQMAIWLGDLQRQHQRLSEDSICTGNTEVRKDTRLAAEENTNVEYGQRPMANILLQQHKLFLNGLSEIHGRRQHGCQTSDGQAQTAWNHTFSKSREGRHEEASLLPTGRLATGGRSFSVTDPASARPAHTPSISFAQSRSIEHDNRRGGEIQEAQAEQLTKDRRQLPVSVESKRLPDDSSQLFWLPRQGTGLRRPPLPRRFPPSKAEGREITLQSSIVPGGSGISTSVYSRGSNVRHEEDPYPHSVMIQLIQPLPTGIKLEMKAHRPTSSTPTNVAGDTSEQPVLREYALRVSLTRHDTKYISFHSLRGILPAYNEAVRLRNKFAGLPFRLPALTFEVRPVVAIPLSGHGPREAFMTVQQRMTYYRQVGRRLPSAFRTAGVSDTGEADSGFLGDRDKDSRCSRPRQCGNRTAGTGSPINSCKCPATPRRVDEEPDSEMLDGCKSATRQKTTDYRDVFSRGHYASSDDNGGPQRSVQGDARRIPWNTSENARSHDETVRSPFWGKASAAAVRTSASIERLCANSEHAGEAQRNPITPPLASLQEVAAVAGMRRVTGGTRRRTMSATDNTSCRQRTNEPSKQNNLTPASPPLRSQVSVTDEGEVETRLNSQVQVEGVAALGRPSSKQKDVPSETQHRQENQDSEASSHSGRSDGSSKGGVSETVGRPGCCTASGSPNYAARVGSQAAPAPLGSVSDRGTPAVKRRFESPSWMQAEINGSLGSTSCDLASTSVSSSACSSKETAGGSEASRNHATAEPAIPKLLHRVGVDFVSKLGHGGKKRRRTWDEEGKRAVADCSD